MNLDPTIFPNNLGTGSAFPAQFRVQEWLNYEEPLRGERLFKIIGPNVCYQGEELSTFRVQSNLVRHGLNDAQVRLLVRLVIPKEASWALQYPLPFSVRAVAGTVLDSVSVMALDSPVRYKS